MMKDDVLVITHAIKAFADIANSLTGAALQTRRESQNQSPLFTGCGLRFAPVDRLCPNRGVNDSQRGRN
jgi:hypothetical protein